MKMNRIITCLSSFILMGSLLVGQAFAQNKGENYTFDLNTLGSKLGLDITAVNESAVPGLKQLTTDHGLFYISDDGEFFMQARVYSLKNGLEDITEKSLKKMRLDGLTAFKDSAIEFTAKNEKYVVNVFTDTTCGYCRKLHNEMAQLNDMGVTVRYLAWPRAGLNSQVYRDTVSIWCSENPQKALSDAKAGESIASASCENQVAEQYKFGKQIGVGGTPNIILPDGSIVPGYKPAIDLVQAIQDAS